MTSHVKRSFLAVLVATLSLVLLLGGNCSGPQVMITNCPTDVVELGSSIDLQVEVSGASTGLVTTTTANNAEVINENSLAPSIIPIESGPVTVVVEATDGAGNTANDTCAFDVVCTADAHCDDGDPCTVDECINMNCEHDDADCSALDDPCNVGVCDAETGICVAQATNEDGLCDDDDACTTGDACVDGICAGEPIVCPPDQQCAEGRCVLCPPDSNCDFLDDQCNVGVCNLDTNSCEKQPTNEGGLCDDGLFCTGQETCVGGQCQSSGDPCAVLGLICDEDEAQCIGPLAADAGPDQATESDTVGGEYLGALVVLSGNASDGSPPYEYSWSLDGEVLGDSQVINPLLSLGVHDVQLRVTDTNTDEVTDIVRIMVFVPQDTSGGLPSESECGSVVIECLCGGVALDVIPLTIDGEEQEITLLERQLFVCGCEPEPNKRLLTRVGANGPEPVQFAGGGSPSCDNCTEDGPVGCTNTCLFYQSGQCDDGGPGADTDVCELGTDCLDCGPRGDAVDCTWCNSWSDTGVFFSDQAAPQVPLQAGPHLIRLRINDGTVAAASEVFFIVNPDPDAVVVRAIASEYCAPLDTLITLEATGFGGTGNYSYLWSPPDGLSDPNSPNPELVMGADTSPVYMVTVQDSAGAVGIGRVILFD